MQEFDNRVDQVIMPKAINQNVPTRKAAQGAMMRRNALLKSIPKMIGTLGKLKKPEPIITYKSHHQIIRELLNEAKERVVD